MRRTTLERKIQEVRNFVFAAGDDYINRSLASILDHLEEVEKELKLEIERNAGIDL